MEYNSNICRLCNAFMQLHIDNPKYRKCSCGNTKLEKVMISLEQYWMGRDVTHSDELTAEITAHAKELLDKVNIFLSHIGIKEAKISSGWRPESINIAAHGAKSSKHLTGQAIDIIDVDGKVRNAILKNLDEAKGLGLFFEDFRWTSTWCHIQSVQPNSGKRIFIPSSNPATAPDHWDGKYFKEYDV